MSSALPSRAVAERALWLPVAEVASDLWHVGSGSTPGKLYAVYCATPEEYPPHAVGWHCDCVHGPGCSHEWAAHAHADPAVRRQLRALVRGSRRMGRAEAAALLDRYDGVVLALATVPPSASIEKYDAARARRNAVAARILARLTGHADADDADA